MLNFPIVNEPVQRDPKDVDEGECSIPFRAWPTEMEFNYYDELKKQEEMIFFKEGRTRLLKQQAEFKIKSALLKACTKGYDDSKAYEDWTKMLRETDTKLKQLLDENKKNFRVMIPHENLNIIANKEKSDKEREIHFYVFSNRMLINGKNSELEVEVWKWHPEESFDNPEKKITRIVQEMDVRCRRLHTEHVQAYPTDEANRFIRRKNFYSDLKEEEKA